MQGGDAAHVRLQLAQLLGTDDRHTRYTVGQCPLPDAVEPRALDLVEGHENLAAGDPADASLFAELLEKADAPAAQHRLLRAGLVIQARMHDAAVAPGLMRCEPVLLLEQRHVRIGATFEKLARYRDADDASADNSDPVGHRRVGVRRAHQFPE